MSFEYIKGDLLEIKNKINQFLQNKPNIVIHSHTCEVLGRNESNTDEECLITVFYTNG